MSTILSKIDLLVAPPVFDITMAEGISGTLKQRVSLMLNLFLTMNTEYDWQTEWVQEDAEETLKEDYETHLDNRRAKPGFDGHHRINCRVCQPPKERNPEAK